MFNDNLPDIIEPLTVMEKPNETIAICEDVFVVKGEDEELEVNGMIGFHWFPRIEVLLKGKVIKNKSGKHILKMSDSYEMIIFV